MPKTLAYALLRKSLRIPNVVGVLVLLCSISSHGLDLRNLNTPVTVATYLNHTQTDDFLSPSELKQLKFDPRRVIGNQINLGFSDQVHWFRLALNNSTEQPKTILLVMNAPMLDEIQLYYGQLEEANEGIAAGDKIPFDQRSVAHRDHVFSLTLAPDQTTAVYFGMRSTGPIRFIPTLWPERQFWQQDQGTQAWFFILAGIITFSICHALILGVKTNKTYYYFFAALAASSLLFSLIFRGYTYQYLFGSYPDLMNQLLPLSQGGRVAFTALFTIAFLNTAKHQRFGHWLLIACAGAAIPITILGLMGAYTLALQLSMWMITPLHLAVMVVSIISWRNGNANARYLILAYSFVTLPALASLLSFTGYINVSYAAAHSGMLSTVTMLVILSVAQAESISLLQRDKIQALEHSENLKNAFLATVSHELRTPINGIEGALELASDEEISPLVKDHLETAMESSHSLLKLVDNILSFSEAQAETLQQNDKDYHLLELLDKLQPATQRDCDKKKLQLNWHLQDDVPRALHGDIFYLRQILQHLLDNAVKFTSRGSISLDVGLYRFQDDQICFKISDTGIGIPRHQQHKIFEYFSQLDATFSRQYTGLGIGLAMCKELARLAGGKIILDSECQQGSNFSLIIPLQVAFGEVEYTAAKEQPIETKEDLDSDYKILVVEDNSVNQKVLKGMLQKLGACVVTADNGADGVAILQAEKVDLVLMDCQMPIMDGFDATREIRTSTGINRDVPIIAVTANAMSGDKDRCLAAGMDDYLRKPVRSSQINEKLVQWLQHHQQARGTPFLQANDSHVEDDDSKGTAV